MIIGENLKQAKEQNLTHYYNTCSKHGMQIFYTKDNVCKQCAKDGRDRRNKENYRFNRARVKFNELKKRAREKNLEFSLTVEDIREMFTTVVCPIFGVPIDYEPGFSDNSPSIDRMDSSKGYTKENCMLISNRANVIKSTGTSAEHMMIAEFMRERGF